MSFAQLTRPCTDTRLCPATTQHGRWSSTNRHSRCGRDISIDVEPRLAHHCHRHHRMRSLRGRSRPYDRSTPATCNSIAYIQYPKRKYEIEHPIKHREPGASRRFRTPRTPLALPKTMPMMCPQPRSPGHGRELAAPSLDVPQISPATTRIVTATNVQAHRFEDKANLPKRDDGDDSDHGEEGPYIRVEDFELSRRSSPCLHVSQKQEAGGSVTASLLDRLAFGQYNGAPAVHYQTAREQRQYRISRPIISTAQLDQVPPFPSTTQRSPKISRGSGGLPPSSNSSALDSGSRFTVRPTTRHPTFTKLQGCTCTAQPWPPSVEVTPIDQKPRKTDDKSPSPLEVTVLETSPHKRRASALEGRVQGEPAWVSDFGDQPPVKKSCHEKLYYRRAFALDVKRVWL